jgi:hypothetical protein
MCSSHEKPRVRSPSPSALSSTCTAGNVLSPLRKSSIMSILKKPKQHEQIKSCQFLDNNNVKRGCGEVDVVMHPTTDLLRLGDFITNPTPPRKRMNTKNIKKTIDDDPNGSKSSWSHIFTHSLDRTSHGNAKEDKVHSKEDWPSLQNPSAPSLTFPLRDTIGSPCLTTREKDDFDDDMASVFLNMSSIETMDFGNCIADSENGADVGFVERGYSLFVPNATWISPRFATSAPVIPNYHSNSANGVRHAISMLAHRLGTVAQFSSIHFPSSDEMEVLAKKITCLVHAINQHDTR